MATGGRPDCGTPFSAPALPGLLLIEHSCVIEGECITGFGTKRCFDPGREEPRGKEWKREVVLWKKKS